MRNSKKFALVLPVLLLALVFIVAPHAGLAQNDAGTCPALVTQALDALGQNCDLLDRNSACYGYNRVDATFTDAQSENFFSTPADRAALQNLQTIETAPLDVNQEFWGIAVLNVQANVPNTLPGQAVTFILLGDVELENAVAPEDVIEPADPITIVTAIGANIRSAPTANANLIGSAPAATELPADGLSPDGNWLRVLFESGTGWISREVIEPVDVSGLPTIDRESRTPMQSFYFSTGFGDPTCNEAPPSLLVVQGPNNVSVDITANGADINIGSTIALMILPGNQLQLIVVSGEAKVGNVIVPEGFKITAPLSEDGKTVVGPPQNFAPLTQEDLNNLQPLENLPANLLHYAIELPTLEEIQAILNFYNNLNNPQNTGNTPNTTGGTTSGQVNCTPFRATSPLGGLPYGMTTFYWDAAPGATSYRVDVFNEGGGQVASFETGGGSTNLNGDLSNVGGGFTFSWQVSALLNGQVACTSGPITMQREAVPTQAPPPPAADVPVSTEEPCWECSF
jgi:hypothetical protein